MPPQENVAECQSENKESVEMELSKSRGGYTNAAFQGDAQEKEQTAVQNEQKKDDPFEFDELLPHVGEFGIYQKILFLLMIPFSFFVAWVYFSQIFITIVPDHWCWVPELANLTAEDRYKNIYFYLELRQII